ncbi:MAG: MotA/TolQ/ExbB proton channel family protein [Rickettsiales bacterium]|jgi:biopolymer transport protein ExbB/TolQ|nr:MotA/TolQ/ExbB proton channel family protein [Rickettsiales bacterium]
MNNSFSFLSIFSPSDPMVFTTSLVLVAGSIISWAIIVGKLRLWNAEKLRPSKIHANDNPDTIADRLIEPLDKNLWFLSVAAAVGPFIGLFGTIWGIMHLFAAVGATGSTSLVVVAPGLAVALGETALGLFVAIPAAIFYQYFSKKSDDLYNKLEMAAKELKKS